MRTNTEPRGYPRSSAGFSNWHIGEALTNRKIQEYARKGFYGSTRQMVALAKQESAQLRAKALLHKEKETKSLLRYLLS